MTKMKYVCNCCGKEYYSYKEKSNYCSNNCRIKDNTFYHNCEYCGNKFAVTKSIHNKYMSGEKKHLYCCKQCVDKAHTTKVTKICIECGKEFEITKCLESMQKFCSQECYISHKNRNTKILTKLCPVCEKSFQTYHHNQIYCSKKCRGISDRNKIVCTCENCGKSFERIKSEVDKNKTHFCSIECKLDSIRWHANDIDILRENYRKTNIKLIQGMLSKKYSIKAIRSRATYYGFSKSRLWSNEEEKIVYDNYDKIPLSEVMKKLPNRTLPSIMHKAREFGLLGYFYINYTYNDNEIEFLRQNYLTMNDVELGKILKRSPNGIHQKLYNLSLIRPTEIHKNGYKNLVNFMRARLYFWKNDIRDKFNYTCCLSGSRSNIVVHHCRSFNLIFEEVIDLLDFPLYNNFEEYNDAQLLTFVEEFLRIQEFYGEYVCITEKLHIIFHKEFGYGDNTIEQWNEFVKKYKYGYYNNVA